jgi:hypothetical protein
MANPVITTNPQDVITSVTMVSDKNFQTFTATVGNNVEFYYGDSSQASAVQQINYGPDGSTLLVTLPVTQGGFSGVTVTIPLATCWLT